MSGFFNRALYRLTRVPAPVDHRSLIDSLSAWLIGTAANAVVDAMTLALDRDQDKKAALPRRSRAAKRVSMEAPK